jgi:hypothetical protein
MSHIGNAYTTLPQLYNLACLSSSLGVALWLFVLLGVWVAKLLFVARLAIMRDITLVPDILFPIDGLPCVGAKGG